MAGVGGFYSSIKTRLAVDNATSNSDDPTPIYVLDELLGTLSADTRAAMDAVCARLANRQPVVKQKALKLVTHIGRKGSPDLRRLMARHSGPVRDLLHYRCDPDPFKGDSVWKRVQEYAQEALEAVHGSPDAAPPPGQSALGGRIQGFGSDAGGGGGGGGGGGSGMQGFGSDSAGGSSNYSSGGGGGRMVGFGSDSVMQSSMQAISSGVRSLGGGRQDGYSSQLGGGSSSSYGGSRPGLASSGGLSQPIIQASGGGSSSTASYPAAPAPTSTAAAVPAGVQLAAEQRLVDRICTPAGLRAAPASEDLKGFVDGLAPLDGPAVAQLLDRKLEAGPWQATLRALCAIESVVESGSSTACGQVAVHFQAHPEGVRRAASSPHASVRQRAQKLLGLLGAASAPGGSGAAVGTATSAGQQQQQQLFTDDLLGEAQPSVAAGQVGNSTQGASLADLLGEPAGTAGTAAAPPAAAPVAAMDLLGGLDVSGPPSTFAAPQVLPQQMGAAAPPPPADDFFGGMLLGDSQQPAATAAAAAPMPARMQPPAAAVAPPFDLLGGLTLGPSSAPALAPATVQRAPLTAVPLPPQQPQMGSGAGGLGDLLGGLSLGAAPPAAAASLGPAFGGMGPGGGYMPGPLQGFGAPAPFGAPAAGMQSPGLMGGAQQMQMHTPPPYQQQHQQQPPFQQPLPGQQHAFASLGSSGGLGAGLAVGNGHGLGMPQPGRQASLTSALSGGSSILSSSGIIDSAKDNSFNFVDVAIAQAKRKH